MCRWPTDSMARRISEEQVAIVLVIREKEPHIGVEDAGSEIRN